MVWALCPPLMRHATSVQACVVTLLQPPRPLSSPSPFQLLLPLSPPIPLNFIASLLQLLFPMHVVLPLGHDTTVVWNLAGSETWRDPELAWCVSAFFDTDGRYS